MKRLFGSFGTEKAMQTMSECKSLSMVLVPLGTDAEEVRQFKRDMQEAFQVGALCKGAVKEGDGWFLPEEHINQKMEAKGAISYKVVSDAKDDKTMLGGVIVAFNDEKAHIDFLYVKRDAHSRGVGKFIMFELERQHPEVREWELVTPYFEKRNIHFYVNVCGYSIVEFFNKHHEDKSRPNSTEPPPHESLEEMFRFIKLIPKKQESK